MIKLLSQYKNIAASFAVKIVGAALALSQTYLISSLLGAEAAGIAFTLFSIFAIMCAVSRLGIGYVVPRFVAEKALEGQWDSASAFLFKSAVFVFIFSCVVAAVFLFVSQAYVNALPQNLESSAARAAVLVFLLCVPIFCTASIVAEGIKGIGMPVHFAIFENFIIKFIFVSALLLSTQLTIGSISYSFLFSNIIGAMYVVTTIYLLTPFEFNISNSVRVVDIAKPAFFFSFYSLSTVIIQWAFPLIISYIGSSADVALFYTAVRTSAVIELLTVSIAAAILPKIVGFAKTLDRKAYIRKLHLLAFLAFISTGVIALPAILFSKQLMALFGAEFVDGSNVLIVSVLGYWIAGALVVYLQSSFALHLERILAPLAVTFAVGGGLAMMLVYDTWGVEGASIVNAATTVGLNLSISAVALFKSRNRAS